MVHGHGIKAIPYWKNYLDFYFPESWKYIGSFLVVFSTASMKTIPTYHSAWKIVSSEDMLPTLMWFFRMGWPESVTEQLLVFFWMTKITFCIIRAHVTRNKMFLIQNDYSHSCRMYDLGPKKTLNFFWSPHKRYTLLQKFLH